MFRKLKKSIGKVLATSKIVTKVSFIKIVGNGFIGRMGVRPSIETMRLYYLYVNFSSRDLWSKDPGISSLL